MLYVTRIEKFKDIAVNYRRARKGACQVIFHIRFDGSAGKLP